MGIINKYSYRHPRQRHRCLGCRRRHDKLSKSDLVDNSDFYGNWQYSQIKDIVGGGADTDIIQIVVQQGNYDLTRAQLSNVENY
jgi:hypothetical protein